MSIACAGQVGRPRSHSLDFRWSKDFAHDAAKYNTAFAALGRCLIALRKLLQDSLNIPALYCASP